MTDHVAYLRSLGACNEAVAFAAQFPSLETAWAACERGDWMLWLAGKVSGPPESASRRQLVMTACACARGALPIFEQRYPQDARPRVAIETAERWARGEAGVTKADVRAAADAAYAAAADAAYAAADAAAAAAAAYAAAYAYAASAADAARTKAKARCADLVRQHYPVPPQKEQAS